MHACLAGRLVPRANDVIRDRLRVLRVGTRPEKISFVGREFLNHRRLEDDISKANY
jgi:hypothetical protein